MTTVDDILDGLGDLSTKVDSGQETMVSSASSWQRVDLAPVLAGDFVIPQPTVFRIEGAGYLFYGGAVNMAWGDSGIGKSWILAVAVAQRARRGLHSMVIDYEDTALTITARLSALGIDAATIAETVHYYRPTDPIGPEHLGHLLAEIAEHDIGFVGIDSLGEAFGIEGIDENSDADVAPWLRRFPRRLADAGPAVMIIDHITKAADNALHPSGSKRKRAAISGAGYLIEQTRPLGKCEGVTEVSGRLAITCAKDRHGNYRRGQRAAEVEVTSWPDGGVTAKVWPIATTEQDLPVILAARKAIRAIKDHGQPASRSVLEELMNIKARATVKRAGIDLAVSWGCIATETGPRGAVLHSFVKDHDE